MYAKPLPAALAIIKIPGNPKLDWNISIINLLTLPQEMLPLREPREVKHGLSGSKGIFSPNDNLEKNLAIEAQQLGSKKKKRKRQRKRRKEQKG